VPDEFDATRTSITSSYTSPSTPGTQAPATAFGPYRLLKPLGEGGMGRVWEAEHEQTSRIVALKIAHSSLNSAEDRERFIREARLAASISHRNCVFVFGAVESAGARAIAMELVRGCTLKDLVKEGKPIDPKEAVRIAIEMIDGLDAAHAKGILHRDIKPANIFIDSDSGAAKVGDFGLSTSISPIAGTAPDVSTQASFAGTPSYASPEQLQGRDLDVRSDIYAVGATLYYLLAGRPPFIERDLITLVASVSARNPDPPSKYNPQVPPDLDLVVLKCLAKTPEARYEDYAALRNALTIESPAPLNRRLLAGAIDSLIAGSPSWLMSQLLWAGNDRSPLRQLLMLAVFGLGFTALGALEGVKGWSPGKLAVGILVRKKLAPPGLSSGLQRSVIFFACQNLPLLALYCFLGSTQGWNLISLQPSPLELCFPFLFLFAPFLMARRSNGWSGLHDRFTATQVTLQRSIVKRVDAAIEEPSIPQPSQNIGLFQLFGESRPFHQSALHNAWDPDLRRRAAIVTHPPHTPMLPLERREAQRRGSLRWIMGERAADLCWDAYEMPDGAPLEDFAHKPIQAALLPLILADLCEELGHNSEATLDLRRVLITQNHRGILCDFPASPSLQPQWVPRESFLLQVAKTLSAGQPPPLSVASILAGLSTADQHPQAANQLRNLSFQPLNRPKRLLQLLLANCAFFSMLISAGFDIWSVNQIPNLQELPATLQRISETKDPAEKALLSRYLKAQFFNQDYDGPGRRQLENALRNAGMKDHKAKLARVIDAPNLAPATPAEIATTRPIVQKLVSQSEYSKLRISITPQVVLAPLLAGVCLQFLIGLVASLITGAPLSFWLTGLALTNSSGTAAPRWRAAARCAIPLALGFGGLSVVAGDIPQAMAIVPTLFVIGFAMTIANYRRGPLERLLGLWVSPR
jgi:serine/threonine protein kinase